jgi:hypothetical protein
MCQMDGDCAGGICNPGTLTCDPTCIDGVQNNGETGVDCGGPNCPDCPPGQGCMGPGDCTSGVCTGNVCQAPACNDGVENGGETDVDCGGPCVTKCGAGQGCQGHADCAGGACNASTMTCAVHCTQAPAVGETCATYCACMMPTCPGKFPSQAACIDACSTFNEAQLCCRAYHCSAAMADPVTHCPHAAGESLCP